MTIDAERPGTLQEDQRLVYREGAFSRFLRRNLPRGLFVRSLLIIIIPMVLLQVVVAAVFMERHWQLVTTRLSAAVTRDIAALIDLSSTPKSITDAELARIARDRMGMLITISPGDQLPPPRPIPLFSILDRTLSEQITQQINLPFWLNTSDDAKTVEIRIKIDNHRILSVVTRRDRAYASNTQIFLIWMAGTSLVLIIISILFLRGQIRPIEALTRAAELFGKGQKPTKAFVPRGADEVRRAGLAFLQMRERIERQIEQRTMMLSGVSHDLRTILTRFRLQLAIADSPSDLEGLNNDVDDMNTMLDGYLDFARGQAEEQQGELDLYQLFLKLEASATLHGKVLVAAIEGNSTVTVRPNAFTRLVTNLTANAWRHAKANIRIEARTTARFLTIVIDDDGPGIPENMREEVFKPFYRLDEARNLDASGTGLGLAIVRDIARGHGGNVTLSDSPLGGLRATVRVPV